MSLVSRYLRAAITPARKKNPPTKKTNLAIVSAYITERLRKFKPMSTDVTQEEETQENTEKND